MERRAEAPPPQGLDFTVENVEKVSESRRPGRGRGGAGGTQRRDAEGAAVLRGMRVGERGGTCSAVPGTARAAGGVPCACRGHGAGGGAAGAARAGKMMWHEWEQKGGVVCVSDWRPLGRQVQRWAGRAHGSGPGY